MNHLAQASVTGAHGAELTQHVFTDRHAASSILAVLAGLLGLAQIPFDVVWVSWRTTGWTDTFTHLSSTPLMALANGLTVTTWVTALVLVVLGLTSSARHLQASYRAIGLLAGLTLAVEFTWIVVVLLTGTLFPIWLPSLLCLALGALLLVILLCLRPWDTTPPRPVLVEPSPAVNHFHVWTGTATHGPYPLASLSLFVAEGRITPLTHLSIAGGAWLPAHHVPGLFPVAVERARHQFS